MAMPSTPSIKAYVDEFVEILEGLKNWALKVMPQAAETGLLKDEKLHADARTILEQRAADRRQLMIETRIGRKLVRDLRARQA